jgi:hypothetical protein
MLVRFATPYLGRVILSAHKAACASSLQMSAYPDGQASPFTAIFQPEASPMTFQPAKRNSSNAFVCECRQLIE